MAFDKHWARKKRQRPRVFKRPATICGRPAHEVVAERRSAVPPTPETERRS